MFVFNTNSASMLIMSYSFFFCVINTFLSDSGTPYYAKSKSEKTRELADVMRQSACLVLNPIKVYSYGFLFNCTTVGQASDSMTALT